MSRKVLGPVRFSYCSIFDPKETNGVLKYLITVLMPKADQELMKTLNEGIEEAKQEGLNKVFGGNLPPNIKTTIHDGDGVKSNGEPYGPECRGCYVMTCSTNEKFPPEIIAGKDRHPAMRDEVKSGDYGYVSVTFAAYDNNGNKGIGSYLNNVYKTKTGEPLGMTRATAQDDFGNLKLNDDAFDNYEIDPLTGQKIMTNPGSNLLPDDDYIPF